MMKGPLNRHFRDKSGNGSFMFLAAMLVLSGALDMSFNMSMPALPEPVVPAI